MASSGVQLLGARQVRKSLAEISSRAHAPIETQAAHVFTILEEGEDLLFAGYHGKYVRTGATKASLTSPAANDAIREAHADELVFGTSVWYARFLTRKVGAKTSRGGRKHDGTSAVLRFPKRMREAIAERYLHEVVYGREL